MLEDKIKGGWAGQVIGCTFGGPTEFRFRGTLINDYQPISWDEGRCKWWYENSPGLYDNIYMDITFVDVIEKEGPDAPASSHAQAFAQRRNDIFWKYRLPEQSHTIHVRLLNTDPYYTIKVNDLLVYSGSRT